MKDYMIKTWSETGVPLRANEIDISTTLWMDFALPTTVYIAGMMEPLNVQFVNETDEIVAATNGWEAGRDSADSDDGTDAAAAAASAVYCGGAASLASDQQLRKVRPPPGKKTMGRVKIKMEYIKNKVRRYTTFSKRKTGIMKKVNALSFCIQ